MDDQISQTTQQEFDRPIPVLQGYSVFQCEGCDNFFPETELGPALYECPECGKMYNRDNSADGESHRCPQDGRYGSKVAEESCPSCSGSPVEEVSVVDCPECGETVLESSYPDHWENDHAHNPAPA